MTLEYNLVVKNGEQAFYYFGCILVKELRVVRGPETHL